MSDPNMHYDGQRWLRWDGGQWLDAASGQPVAGAPIPPGGGGGNRGLMWLGIGGGVVLVLILIVVAAVVVGSGAPKPSPSSSASSSASSSPTQSASPSPSSSVAAYGQPVRDGKFEFVVKAVNYPASKKAPHGAVASGTWVVVTVGATNISDASASLFAYKSPAFNAAGTSFSPNPDETSGTLYNQTLNPGLSVNGALWYDVPVGTKLTVIEFHDSPYSGGAKASLVK